MPESIYQSIAKRTQGDIYIGVVGPVRTGKSSFIKRFMDVLVLPHMEDGAKKQRAADELPQSATGKTIMTTEPKFIPEQAAEVTLEPGVTPRVRLIDCVGYIVPGSVGYLENEQPRMVHTPWFEREIPFNLAAEIGTQKVISEHSTIGLVVTTDGSFGEIPRSDYEEAEARVVSELQTLQKPFIILLNSAVPAADETVALAAALSQRYGAAVMPVDCTALTEDEICAVMKTLLYSFPLAEVRLDLPPWLLSLPRSHPLRAALTAAVREEAASLRLVRDVAPFVQRLCGHENVAAGAVRGTDLSAGSVTAALQLDPTLFYAVLSESAELEIADEAQLLRTVCELARANRDFARFRTALDDVEREGYGIVLPTPEEMTLEEPEIMKQGGRYGVRLKASAPSIHMMKAQINTVVAPVVGSESQSEELIMYLLKEFEEDPQKIWASDIFGKKLSALVNEGLHNKLFKMPAEARRKLQETLERVINEGCSGLICIIL
ncbi:MAG: stage IV sporulation protein A [Clostridia bacterium]|nr:stage IV sporulation protein A [Clostridia bacterium]